MSTPIQHDELSPHDPKYYAPRKWRDGEIDAPQIQATPGEAELADLQDSADCTFLHDSPALADEFPNPSNHSEDLEYKGVRIIALVTAVGVSAWIAFCITVGLQRLDTATFTQWRNGLLSAKNAEISVSERVQAANAALQDASRPVFAPTLVVADASGDVNAALPLAIKVTNYTPGTTINLSGLVVGTILSSGFGASPGENQWRIPVDDLPNTLVIPPPDYVGLMTAVAELRSADGQAIVRTPVRLTWRPAAETTESVEPEPSALPLSDHVTPKDSSATQPKLKARRHERADNFKGHSVANKRRHRAPSSDQELQTEQTSGLGLPFTHDLFADATRESRSYWNSDLQTIIDRSWDRCAKWSDCGGGARR
jgi:hypothetical protein